jgi:predicted nucleic acid-binding protein
MSGKEKGAHEWIIEFRKAPDEIEHFTELLDEALKKLNSDYEAKRYNNMTLTKPKVHIAPEKTFYNWLKSKNKLGGQHKIPRLSNDRNYVDELLQMNQ